MFKFFWSRNASQGMAMVYIALGLPLLLFPAAVGTVFVWVLAGGCLVFAVPHLLRYLQARKAGQSHGGELFLCVLPLLFALFALLRPHVILSFLPFVLGALLLLDGVGKLPLMLEAIQAHAPGLAYCVVSTLIPLAAGLVLLLNPFQAAQMVIRFFGLGLILDGVGDLITARSLR